ncbi:Kelch repeat-containing protein [Neorhodopirellula lusitana]|uniref:Kelch repeat-containing protein n=1 Tax=Neorhodopirellula lusitana TaxID=445327 RepID=UPI00384B2CA9
MSIRKHPFPIGAAVFLFSAFLLSANQGHAHFPWLSTDKDGKAVMWFGESPDDCTYPMPDSIQAIQLVTGESNDPVATTPVNSDTLVGLQSDSPIQSVSEISGSVTYGLYHGTKLTYHVEHLSQSKPEDWPTKPRENAALQSVVRAESDGGVEVTVLHHGKPLANTKVALYCEEGHEEAARETDKEGVVRFTAKEVEEGLNAIVVGVTDKNASGTHGDEAYSSTTDYLTATFRVSQSDEAKPTEPEPADAKPAEPQVDPNSSVSIVPAELPELPEELTSFGAAIAGNHLYVYGGHTGSAHSYSIAEQSNRFWALDLSAGKKGEWKQLPSGPSLQGLALLAHGDDVIRIGGFTAMNEEGEEQDLRSQTSVTRFDTKTNQWTKLADLPEPRSSLDAAVLGDVAYVFGGWSLQGESEDSQWHQTAWSLDLTDPNAAWKPLAQPPFRRRAISVAAHHGKLFVIGGMGPEDGPVTRVDVYDPKTDSWGDAPSVPGKPMSGFGTASFATGGKLYVTAMDGFVHQLNDDGKQWSTVAKSDPARFFHRMLPISDNELLMIGGANMQIGKFTNIDLIQLGQSE